MCWTECVSRVHDQILSPDQVAIHHFEREGLEVRVTTPVLASNGWLDVWPTGFFDQHERICPG